MTIRQWAKFWVYNSCPGYAGSFPYWGTKAFFPKGSLSFKAACAQGTFEESNVKVLLATVVDSTTMFDVGANIGLMAVPVLRTIPSCSVISFDPSPNTVPYLRRTQAESSFAARWKIIDKAVGPKAGTISFSLSSIENSLYDGIRPTKRVESVSQVEVEMTTIDHEWVSLSKPQVSVIKIDVEGSEVGVLKGAAECIGTCRPHILLEWNRTNLAAYDCTPESLLSIAAEFNCRVMSVPGLHEVTDNTQLKLHMQFTENFLLSPLN